MAEVAAHPAAAECAVCWGEFSDDAPVAELPCHVAPAGSTMQYCVRCIQIICETSPGGVGRCPTCRAFLKKADGSTFEVSDRVETCTLCQQPRTIIGDIRGHPVCDACMLGNQNPLRYECQRCGRNQRIPHPMYRYQATPEEFGNDSWACHNACGDFTHWRVLAADVALVPDADAPEGWGRREEWLERIRQQRQEERRTGVPGRPAAVAHGTGRWIDSWQGMLSIFGLVAAMLYWR